MRTKAIVLGITLLAALGAAYALRGRIGALGATPAAQADGDPVIAKVNAVEIHRSDLDKRVARMTRGQAPAPDQVANLERGALKDLVSGHLLLEEAARRGISASPEEVQQQVSQLEQRAGGDAGLEKALSENQINRTDLEQGLARDITISKLLEAVAPAEPVSREAEQAFYDSNPQLFAAPESVRARHILIRVAGDASAEQKDAARKKADELLAQLRSGVDFATLAGANSEDPGSAQKGGDLGFFPRGAMTPPFESAAFALQPGELSDLVETEFGFHILKVEERRPAGQRSFEEVEPSIARYLGQQKQQGQLEQFVSTLRVKASVEVLDPKLAGEPAPPASPAQSPAAGVAEE
ncbi:MAG TPA: peptidylprolyl isomerase [Acidobacteriota bacterium]